MQRLGSCTSHTGSGRRLKLTPGKVANRLRRRTIESHHIHHSSVVGIGDREPIGDHSYHHEAGGDSRFLAIISQSPAGGNVAGPGFVVGIDHKGVDF